MAIPTYDFLEKPYVEKDFKGLLYDYNESRYIPSIDLISREGYISLIDKWGSRENAQSYLDLVSRAVYTYIMQHYDNKYRFQILYYMSHSKQIRNALIQIFISSVWYNHRDGGFLLVYSSGINMDQMKEFSLDLKRAFSPIERQIIDNSFLGTRVLDINFNNIVRYDTFIELKDSMLTDSLITEDEYDNADTTSDLMNILKIRVRYRIYINEQLKYCLEDTRHYENVILASKFEFNNASGNW